MSLADSSIPLTAGPLAAACPAGKPRSELVTAPGGLSPGRGPGRLLREAGLAGPALALLGGLLGGLGLAGFGSRLPEDLAHPVGLGLALWSLAALALAGYRLHARLLTPLLRLETGVARICQGEPGASAVLRPAGVLDVLAGDVLGLNQELADLYEDMDRRVASQTVRLAQKTAAIKILYDVAAGINAAESLDGLLLRFLRMLKEMVNGRAATVRLVMEDGRRRLVGSIGLDNGLVDERDMAPVDLCLCGNVLSPGDILCNSDERFCSRLYGRRMFRGDEIEVVTVPLEHHDELLGLYTIFVDKPGVGEREDILELVFSIGHHLGIAVAKYRSDTHARRLSIIEERNSLAHELHDSLAQTLASLRFQGNLLADSLASATLPETARTDLERLRGGLDEAHTELRSLLTSFRAPIDRLGLAAALEKLTERFAQHTGRHVLFQNHCRPFTLSATTELQVTRIAQEALANIRKHSRAQTVRVLLTRAGEGDYVLLVEDDGVGFRSPETGCREGERIGLSIMRERARRIGAELRIESEPEEGTRIELQFPPERPSPP